MPDITHLNGVALVKKKGGKLYVVSDPEGVADESPIIAEGTTTPRMLKDRFADIVNVKDYGAVGDGQHDDTEAIQAALDAGRGKTVFIPAGLYLISKTLIARTGSSIIGAGYVDFWNSNYESGTVLRTNGPGNPAKWTDIYEGDETTETPLLVAGGNGIWVEGITLQTTNDNLWSIGLFYPSVKQCGFSRVSSFGFNNAPIYLDVTWSDRNETLKTLHPDIESSAGMNEFYGESFYAHAGGASSSIGLKIQGTTRDPDNYASTDDWLWGYGGASDVVFMKGRSNGIWVDGRIKGNSLDCIQGIRFICVDSRTGSRKTMIHIGRATRVDFIGGYGEPTPGVTARAEFYSYTGSVNFLFTEYRADTYLDDVATGYRLTNGPVKGSMVTIVNSYGDIYKNGYILRDTGILPNEDGGFSIGTSTTNVAIVNSHVVRSLNQPLVLRETYTDVLSLSETSCAFHTGNIVPVTTETISLGTSSYRWSNVATKTVGYNSAKTDTGYFENLYTTSGSVSTSDYRLKESISNPTDALLRAWGNVGFKVFQFKDAVEKKGSDAARYHVGVIAQDVQSAFSAQGLDASKYGLFCYDEWKDGYENFVVVDQPASVDENGEVITPAVTHTEQKKIFSAGNQFGIRYEEALALECAYLRNRLSKIETALSANNIKVEE